MSADRILLGLAALGLLAHAGAIWLALRGWWRALPLLNLAVAMPILAYQLLRMRRVRLAEPDAQILTLLALEGAILLLALLALHGSAWARRLSVAGFALHLLGNLAVLVFALTFRIGRMF